MDQGTRLERRLDRWVARAVTPRGAAAVIASVTTTITIAAGVVMTAIDREDFPTLGSGLWWAVQTVTTVGYGDRVPTTTAGQVVAALVMLIGIGFVTVITASITTAFMGRQSSRARASSAEVAASAEQLRRIEERLERIEAALGERR